MAGEISGVKNMTVGSNIHVIIEEGVHLIFNFYERKCNTFFNNNIHVEDSFFLFL